MSFLENTTFTFMIPIKDPARAKSRLLKGFPGEIRDSLRQDVVSALAIDLIEAIVTFKHNNPNRDISIIICSPENISKKYLEQFKDDVDFLDESNIPKDCYKNLEGLDKIIEFMNDRAVQVHHAKATILLMSDLPLVDSKEIARLFEFIEGLVERKAGGFVACTPSPGNGCNMVCRSPPTVSETCYSGRERPSFIGMIEAARHSKDEKGVDIEIFDGIGFYLDLDTPGDLVNVFPLLELKRPGSRLLALLKDLDLDLLKEAHDNRVLLLNMKTKKHMQVGF